MKKILFLILSLLGTLQSSAQCSLSVSTPVEDITGDWLVDISLHNPGVKITTIQFDLTVSSDFSFDPDNYNFAARAKKLVGGKLMDTHSIYAHPITNGGTIRVLVYSMDTEAIQGEDGVFMTIRLTGLGSAHAAPCNLTNVVLAQLDDEGRIKDEVIYPQAVINDYSMPCYDVMDDDAVVIGAMNETQLNEMQTCFITNPSLKLVNLTHCTNAEMGSLPILNDEAWIYCAFKGQVDNTERVLYMEGDKLVKDELVLDESADVCLLPIDFVAKEFLYKRNFKNDKWQALYLPVELDVAKLLPNYAVANVESIKEKSGIFYVVANSITEGTLKPNTPYFIKAKNTGEQTIAQSGVNASKSSEESISLYAGSSTFTFTGSYALKTDMYATGAYGMSDGGLKQAENASVSLGTYRWFMLITGGAGVKEFRLLIDSEEADGLSMVESEKKEAVTFDLQGRRVSPRAHGVYITNGKKVLR
ncbi:MAG: hypothetical protein MJZ60_01735 [Bacteroidaceae bacterium]|nr:hypothetical protein [Bacteroidaceae bacterium]